MALPVVKEAGASAGASIQLRQLVKKYENAAGKVTVLKGIDLTLLSGEFAAIIGKSGSGKSTLLNMITGIDHPTSGEVMVAGTHIYKMNESRRALWRGQHLGIVFQFFQLLPMLTLLENTMLPMDYCKTFSPAARPQRAMNCSSWWDWTSRPGNYPQRYPQASSSAPPLRVHWRQTRPLLLRMNRRATWTRALRKPSSAFSTNWPGREKTIVMVTHDPSLTERTTRQVIISDGEIVDTTVSQALPQLITNRCSISPIW